MSRDAFHERPWTRRDYARLLESGAFEPGPTPELIDGLLTRADQRGRRHDAAVALLAAALGAAFGRGWSVMVQRSLALDADNELEPDVMVIPGPGPSGGRPNPSRLVLVAEVVESDSGVKFHRQDKGSLYARAGAPDYWLVNLVEGWLEVYRGPFPWHKAPYGWAYRRASQLPRGYHASPWAVEAPIAVADLLP